MTKNKNKAEGVVKRGRGTREGLTRSELTKWKSEEEKRGNERWTMSGDPRGSR